MKIAVTGGSGQLGTLVLRRLIEDRKIKRIVSLDVRPPLLVSAKLEAVHADVRDPAVGRHLAGCDALVHLAFLVTQLAPRDVFDAINIGGSKNVIRAAAEAGVRHVLYASSVAAYGIVPGHPVPLTEASLRIFQPDFAYPASKYLVEEFLDDFEKEHPDILVTRFRPSALIGARMEHPLGQFLRRRVLPDTGAAPMPMVWDEDVADAFVLALKKGAAGAYILSADEPLPAAELARAAGMRAVRIPRAALSGFAQLSPYLARLGLTQAVDPQWPAHAHVVIVPSSEHARKELGWTPRCASSAEVVRRYAETVPGRVDPRIAGFLRLAGLAMRVRGPIPELRSVEACVHLDLTGPGGGDYTLHVAQQRVHVSSGAPRPPTSVARLPARLFVDLLAGRTDFSSAQFTGKIRVEGDPFAGLFLGGLVSMFRTESRMPGLRGLLPRTLARWF